MGENYVFKRKTLDWMGDPRMGFEKKPLGRESFVSFAYSEKELKREN